MALTHTLLVFVWSRWHDNDIKSQIDSFVQALSNSLDNSTLGGGSCWNVKPNLPLRAQWFSIWIQTRTVKQFLSHVLFEFSVFVVVVVVIYVLSSLLTHWIHTHKHTEKLLHSERCVTLFKIYCYTSSMQQFVQLFQAFATKQNKGKKYQT